VMVMKVCAFEDRTQCIGLIFIAKPAHDLAREFRERQALQICQGFWTIAAGGRFALTFCGERIARNDQCFVLCGNANGRCERTRAAWMAIKAPQIPRALPCVFFEHTVAPKSLPLRILLVVKTNEGRCGS